MRLSPVAALFLLCLPGASHADDPKAIPSERRSGPRTIRYQVDDAEPGDDLVASSRARGANGVFMMKDYFAFKDFDKSLAADDRVGGDVLIKSGRATLVDNDTKVRVLKYTKALFETPAVCEVRIMSGPRKDEAGYVAIRDLNRLGPLAFQVGDQCVVAGNQRYGVDALVADGVENYNAAIEATYGEDDQVVARLIRDKKAIGLKANAKVSVKAIYTTRQEMRSAGLTRPAVEIEFKVGTGRTRKGLIGPLDVLPVPSSTKGARRGR